MSRTSHAAASLPTFAVAAWLGTLVAGGCYNVQTNFQSCETNEECSESTDGAFDYCGQEGSNFCCRAGAFKCGCTEALSCLEDYECYECPASLCANAQPTICLDPPSGGSFGLERATGPEH